MVFIFMEVHTVVSRAMNDLFLAKFCDFSEGLLVLVFEWDRVVIVLILDWIGILKTSL